MFQQWDLDFMVKNKPSIQYLELYAVTAAVTAWIHKLKNRRVSIFTDNDSVKTMLNTNTSSCKNCMVLIRIIVLLQLIHNTRIYAKHVKSEDNGPADDLSRLKIRKFIKNAEKAGFIPKRCKVPHEIWPLDKLWLV